MFFVSYLLCLNALYFSFHHFWLVQSISLLKFCHLIIEIQVGHYTTRILEKEKTDYYFFWKQNFSISLPK